MERMFRLLTSKKWQLFLRWWLMFILICLGTVTLYGSGILYAVNKVDFTKISFLIYFIFMIFTVRIGTHVFQICKKDADVDKKDIAEFSQKNESAWFASDAFLTLGMIGTVFGFIYMLATIFSSINVSDIGGMKLSLAKMSYGMSAALYTTAAGLVCSLVLKIQLFDFTQHLDKLAEMYGCEVKVDKETL